MRSYRGHFLLETVKGDILTQKMDLQLPFNYFENFFYQVPNYAICWTLRAIVVEVVFRFSQLMKLEGWKKTLQSTGLRVTI